MENAQKKFDEAQKKLREAESSCSEARRYERMAAIKLHEVEAREDELRRRLVLFNSQYVMPHSVQIFLFACYLSLCVCFHP